MKDKQLYCLDCKALLTLVISVEFKKLPSQQWFCIQYQRFIVFREGDALKFRPSWCKMEKPEKEKEGK